MSLIPGLPSSIRLYGRPLDSEADWLHMNVENNDRTNLTDATREMIKKSTEDVKKFASWPTVESHGVRMF